MAGSWLPVASRWTIEMAGGWRQMTVDCFIHYERRKI